MTAVCGIAVLLLEPGVQAVFRRLSTLRYRHIKAAQSKIGRPHLNEQGFDRLDPGAQIVQSPEHQVPTRKRSQRALVHGPIIRVTHYNGPNMTTKLRVALAAGLVLTARGVTIVLFGTVLSVAPC